VRLRVWSAMCVDNYVIGEAGAAERVHRYPRELIAI
jgi:hypothetical protein